MDVLSDHVTALIEQYGALALFVTLTLETLGAPVPGESALIAAATAAGAGKMQLWQVALAAFAGAVAGGSIGYVIGRLYGRTTLVRYGARFGLDDTHYARLETLFNRYGAVVVIGARFVVLLRQINGLVAGATGMAPGRFFLANAIGSALWVAVWVTLAGAFGHEAVQLLPEVWHHLGLVAMFATPALIVLFFLLGRRRRRRAAGPPPNS